MKWLTSLSVNLSTPFWTRAAGRPEATEATVDKIGRPKKKKIGIGTIVGSKVRGWPRKSASYIRCRFRWLRWMRKCVRRERVDEKGRESKIERVRKVERVCTKDCRGKFFGKRESQNETWTEFVGYGDWKINWEIGRTFERTSSASTQMWVCMGWDIPIVRDPSVSLCFVGSDRLGSVL